MSRTKAHESWDVRLRREGVEYHDHTTGSCDLLPVAEWTSLGKKRWTRRCGWDLPPSVLAQRPMCSCSVCRPGEKSQETIRRRQDKVSVREELIDNDGE